MRKVESVSDHELELLQDFLGLPWGSTNRSRNATRSNLRAQLEKERVARISKKIGKDNKRWFFLPQMCVN